MTGFTKKITRHFIIKARPAGQRRCSCSFILNSIPFSLYHFSVNIMTFFAGLHNYIIMVFNICCFQCFTVKPAPCHPQICSLPNGPSVVPGRTFKPQQRVSHISIWSIQVSRRLQYIFFRCQSVNWPDRHLAPGYIQRTRLLCRCYCETVRSVT